MPAVARRGGTNGGRRLTVDEFDSRAGLIPGARQRVDRCIEACLTCAEACRACVDAATDSANMAEIVRACRDCALLCEFCITDMRNGSPLLVTAPACLPVHANCAPSDATSMRPSPARDVRRHVATVPTSAASFGFGLGKYSRALLIPHDRSIRRGSAKSRRALARVGVQTAPEAGLHPYPQHLSHIKVVIGSLPIARGRGQPAPAFENAARGTWPAWS